MSIFHDDPSWVGMPVPSQRKEPSFQGFTGIWDLHTGDNSLVKLVPTGEVFISGPEQWPEAPENWWGASMSQDSDGRFIIVGNCILNGWTWPNCEAEWTGERWELVVANGQEVFTV